MNAQANAEISERISSLEADVSRHREDSAKAQAEVDRLLDILRQMENEKNDKDRKISELERSVFLPHLLWKCDYFSRWCSSQSPLCFLAFLLPCLGINIKTFSVFAFDEADVLTGLLFPPFDFCIEALFFLTLSGL